MKNILLLLTLIPLFSFNSIETDYSIIGKWEGIDEQNEIGYLLFDSDGYATIEMGGEVIGGSLFEIGGNQGSMTYTANLNTTPVKIDLIVTLLATKQEKKMLFIGKFINEDTIILASDFNDVRPSAFTTDNSIRLNRVE